MKIKVVFVLIVATCMSCVGKRKDTLSKPTQIPVAGTWKLITGMVVEKGDTAVTDYTIGTEKVESAGVNRVNIEKYIRVKK